MLVLMNHIHPVRIGLSQSGSQRDGTDSAPPPPRSSTAFARRSPLGTRCMPGARKRLEALPIRFRVSGLGLSPLCRFRDVLVRFQSHSVHVHMYVHI